MTTEIYALLAVPVIIITMFIVAWVLTRTKKTDTIHNKRLAFKLRGERNG